MKTTRTWSKIMEANVKGCIGTMFPAHILLHDGNAMRGVKRGFGMLFTPRGRLTRHIRAPSTRGKLGASTEKLGGIGLRREEGFGGPERHRRHAFAVSAIRVRVRDATPAAGTGKMCRKGSK